MRSAYHAIPFSWPFVRNSHSHIERLIVISSAISSYLSCRNQCNSLLAVNHVICRLQALPETSGQKNAKIFWLPVQPEHLVLLAHNLYHCGMNHPNSSGLRQCWRTARHAAAVFTDWLLIGSGLLLAGIALLRIDVPSAKWVLFACGLLFSFAGDRFRRQRQRRQERLAVTPPSTRARHSEKSA